MESSNNLQENIYRGRGCPDSKSSDKNILLSKMQQYLNLQENEKVWDDFGIKIEYLFY